MFLFTLLACYLIVYFVGDLRFYSVLRGLVWVAFYVRLTFDVLLPVVMLDWLL